MAEYLGLESALGLTNVLVGQLTLEEALQPWGVDGMFVLASGSVPPNPSELLGSVQTFHQLVGQGNRPHFGLFSRLKDAASSTFHTNG